MNTPLVSVIIPVYNGEKVIERCLRSIIGQTYKNLEILVLNDGSRDHTRQILDKYADMDARVHAIHKENSGVSDTRNQGIRLATGKYILFVDSDDWLPADSAEVRVRAMEENCDMVICDYNRVVEKNIVIRGSIEEEGVISKTDYALYMMKAPADFYFGVLWNKLYRRDIIVSRHIEFQVDLDWSEDLMFNLEYLKYVEWIWVLQKALYYYVLTKGSLVNSRSGSDLVDTLRIRDMLFEKYKALYESLDLYEEHKLSIRRFYVDFARDKVKSIERIQGIKLDEISRAAVLEVVKEKLGDTIDNLEEKLGIMEVISKPAPKKTASRKAGSKKGPGKTKRTSPL